MTGNLLDQGIALMLYGMGTVFLFLILLIVATNIMSWIVLRFFPDVRDGLEPVQVGPQKNDNQTPIAVITAALYRYRSKHK